MVRIALLVGPILRADLRLVGALRGLDPAARGVLRRTAMLARLAMIALALLNALTFERMASRKVLATMPADGTGLAFALVSLLFWLLVILLGRWSAFA